MVFSRCNAGNVTNAVSACHGCNATCTRMDTGSVEHFGCCIASVFCVSCPVIYLFIYLLHRLYTGQVDFSQQWRIASVLLPHFLHTCSSSFLASDVSIAFVVYFLAFVVLHGNQASITQWLTLSLSYLWLTSQPMYSQPMYFSSQINYIFSYCTVFSFFGVYLIWVNLLCSCWGNSFYFCVLFLISKMSLSMPNLTYLAKMLVILT